MCACDGGRRQTIERGQYHTEATGRYGEFYCALVPEQFGVNAFLKLLL